MRWSRSVRPGSSRPGPGCQHPLPKHPHTTPFAWALIRLDGADTAMLHTVEVDGPDALATGDRVVARFRPAGERVGAMSDIDAFVPEASASSSGSAGPRS